MTKLLVKIEQDYGLPVAISFAKQVIKQDHPKAQTLRKNNKTEVFTSGIISSLLIWKKSDEGEEFWRDICHRYDRVKTEFLLSYNDLEEYAAKDPNNKNLLQKLEEDQGKEVTTSFVKQLFMNKTGPLYRYLENKTNLYCICIAIYDAFNWERSVEGHSYWYAIADAYTNDTKKYEISLQILEDYIKSIDPKTVKTIEIDTMQKTLKEPQAMIAPFNKGNLNIKGIIHQAAKGIKDDRPFVIALIDEELERIKTVIKNIPKDTFNYEGYDIRVHCLRNLILETKTAIESDETFKISPIIAIRFYEFEKLSKKPLDCSWIKSYLTQENMQKPSVSLFKSNKMTIKLEKGLVSMTNLKDKRTYGTPVLYDKTKNEFYL